MTTNQTYTEAEIQRTAIFALDQVTGVFRACEVDVDGVLQTTAGSGGGGSGGDVRIKDATLSQFASVDASGRLSVNVAGTVPVSGPLTDAQLRASAVPVMGVVDVANFPATQPISGAVAISGSVAVTGPLTDAQLRAAAVPVSLASVPTHGVTGPLTNTELRAAAVPVSLASLPPLVAGSANIGDVDVLTLPALPAGTNRIGSVRPVDSADADLTTTKWTVPAGRYLATTDAKDLGRTLVVFSAGPLGNGYTTVGTAETLITFAWSKDHAALVSGTSYTVPVGKRLRILGGWILERSTTGNTTTAIAFLRMRGTTGAALAVGSPLQLQAFAKHPATASDVSVTGTTEIPEGIEMQAGWVFGFSAASTGWTATTCVPLWEFSIVAFEY
jgi:hypothetical protein